MESRELNLNREYKEMNLSDCKGGDGFIDRSKVRILLCDNESKSLKEVLELLLECSYQVTPVKSARQVIDALNAEGPDIDIILAEVDLPMKKGMKMLKYITRDKNLYRIPVIMMSRQDEVSVVVKCLKLGAADYLVKPLRTNELLNLWTHMWRRRRMLGLAEKNLLNYDFDLVASDPSDANTNSTTLFSDDTDDKTRRCMNSEAGALDLKENESLEAANAGAADGTATSVAPSFMVMDPPSNHVADSQPDIPGKSGHAGQLSSIPKKSKLKIGESSAFFSYKSTIRKTNCQGVSLVTENDSHHLTLEESLQAAGQGINNSQRHENGDAQITYPEFDDFHGSASAPDSLEKSRTRTPPASLEFHNRTYNQENMSQVVMNPSNALSQANVSTLSAQTPYPYYMHGVMNQAMMQQQSSHVYAKNMHDMHGHHAAAAMLPQYSHHFPHHPNGMSGFPYYRPMSICLQPGQMGAVHPCSSVGNTSSPEVKLNKVDRREAALIKFRQKRKERCFDKKIRYVNRKKLAERRPRVRGQFVRKVNGVSVDLNGQPESAEYDEDEEYEDEENASRDSSPEGDAL